MGTRIAFDKDWKFFRGDLLPHKDTDRWGGAKAKAYDFGATAISLDDSAWRAITLPHDFVSEGDYTRKLSEDTQMQSIPEMESMDSRHHAGGSLEGGVAWYRKRFTLPEDLEGKRVHLHFDGVYRDSTVYLNQYFVGNYANGYTSFYYDITDFINEGEENVLAVRVDASGREGWWYEGGGIYRHVWLEIKEEVYIEPWGVFAAPKVDLETMKADISISTEIMNKRLEDKEAEVESVIKDAEGNIVAAITGKTLVHEWDGITLNQEIRVENVNLWSLETPYLYTLETKVSVDGKVMDTCETNFGIRDVKFDANEGFLLNGKKVRIQGLCCHHDHAGVGIGVPDSVQEYRIAQMKSMGANGYRCAHHQPTTELLDICDRMGMLVMDETRRMSSANIDIEQLRTLIKRDRNHPSIFIWGIGNEEVFSQDKPETKKTTITMRTEVRKLDPTRPITSAVVCWNGVERFEHARAYMPITKELDVMGFNYCKTAWDDYHEKMPQQPIIITEASSNSGTRGCYSTDESKGQYYILDENNFSKCKNQQKSVKKDMGETEWKYFAERPYLSGIFLWTGMDYKGEPTPLTWPAVSSQFGIFDSCGYKKDNYYYYKSWWTNENVLHVFPHWNHEGMEGKTLAVHCYSNLDEVEIFVNGKSYGRKQMEENWYLTWEDVVYEPGILLAKGYRNGVEVMTDEVKTVKKPDRIILTAEKENVTTDTDAVIIHASIVDEDNNFVPYADNELNFTIEGVGEFLGVGNGNPGSHESDKIPVRRAFNGLCQLLVRTTGETGEIKVKAASPGIKAGECTVKIV